MRLRAFPSHLLQVGVAPLAAVTLIAVGASGTTVLTTPAAQSAAQTQVLTATPAVDEALAAPTRSSIADLEAEAIALADEFGAVPVDESGRLCPATDLEVRWSEPERFTHGAFIAPLGPPPVDGVEDVNGVVVCGASTWAYMGFEAAHDGATWAVTAVPYVNEEEARPEELNLDAEVDPHEHDDEPAPEPAPADPSSTPSPKPTVETSAWLAGLGAIEPYAAYEPQSACSPTAKPGTVTMKDALLASYPVTRNLGIARACHLGGRSEHKEGRAFDWGAYVSRAGERASVEQFLTQLLATDADGNRHALARRMGVMYVIWNGQIWSAYRPGDGWRRYGGPNPHTDHAHVSLSRAGGAGKTSFFAQGLAAKGVLREVPPGASAVNTAAVVAAPIGAPKVTTVAARPTESRRRDAQTSGGDGSSEERRERREFTAEQRAAWEAYQKAAEAERQTRREQRRETEDVQRGEWRQRRQEAEAQQRAEWQARREAAEAQQRAEWQARREAETAKRAERQQRRQEAEAQQRAEWQARREAETAKRAEWEQRRQEAGTAKRAERQRRKEAAEAAWRERRQRRQPAPSPAPTPSPTASPSPSPSPEPEPAPVVSEPEPAVTEAGPAEGG